MVFPRQVSRALHPGPPRSFAHPLTLQTRWLALRTCVVLSQAPGTQRREPRCGLASSAAGRGDVLILWVQNPGLREGK